jgi:hypothetical protein
MTDDTRPSHEIGLPVTLPDTSVAKPRTDQTRSLAPIRPPEPVTRRLSLAQRRLLRLVQG